MEIVLYYIVAKSINIGGNLLLGHIGKSKPSESDSIGSSFNAVI